MFNFLIALVVIAAICLILIVLAQNPKGGGLSQTFGGGNQYMGVEGTNKFLTKATWTLVIFMVVVSVLAAGFVSSSDVESSSSKVVNEASKAVKEQTESATTNLPGVPAE